MAPKVRVAPSKTARMSRSRDANRDRLRLRFVMLDALRNDTTGKHLRTSHSFIARSTVRGDSGKFRDFRKPTAVVLSFCLVKFMRHSRLRHSTSRGACPFRATAAAPHCGTLPVLPCTTLPEDAM